MIGHDNIPENCGDADQNKLMKMNTYRHDNKMLRPRYDHPF
jgi:hypothetical protein